MCENIRNVKKHVAPADPHGMGPDLARDLRVPSWRRDLVHPQPTKVRQPRNIQKMTNLKLIIS